MKKLTKVAVTLLAVLLLPNQMFAHTIALDKHGLPLAANQPIATFARLSFPDNSKSLSKKQMAKLESVRKFFNAHEAAQIYVRAFTSGGGSSTKDERLSKQRAEAVTKVLADDYSIPMDSIHQRWYGSAHPLYSNYTKAGRAINRRAWVTVTAWVKVDS